MARVIATGPPPTNPDAMAGTQAGNLFSQVFAQQLMEQQQAIQEQNAFELAAQSAAGPAPGMGRGFGVLAPDELTAQQQEPRRARLARFIQERPQAARVLFGTESGRSMLNLAFGEEDPEVFRQLRALGIDLNTEEGRQIGLQAIGVGDSGFTLGEGQSRFDASGNVVAENPKGQSFSRVVSSDSELNKRFGLGIPSGDSARVEFTRDPQTGGITNASVQSAFGTPSTNVNVNMGGKFQEELGKGAAPQINELITSGQSAVGTEQSLIQMGELLNSGVQTGTLQPALTGLQGVAADLGVSLDTAAQNLGINLGELSSKEEFDRLSTKIIIDGFEKFKGNLNAREVQLAENAFANLGRSEEANRDGVAAALAAQRIARERGLQASEVRTFDQARGLQSQILSQDVSKFEQYKKEFKEQLKQSTSPDQAPPDQLPDGLPDGSKQVGQTEAGLPVYETPDGRRLVVE